MFGGEFPFSVKGITPVASHDEDCCDLNMIDIKKKRRVFMGKKVPDEFMAHYIIGAGSRRCYFVATCKNGRAFRSREVRIGGDGMDIECCNNPVDLGVFIGIL